MELEPGTMLHTTLHTIISSGESRTLTATLPEYTVYIGTLPTQQQGTKLNPATPRPRMSLVICHREDLTVFIGRRIRINTSAWRICTCYWSRQEDSGGRLAGDGPG